jgi:hypothetical protein
MTTWSELHPHERPKGLPSAARRQVAPGVYAYSFVHDDLEVDNPTLDVTGRFFVSPREYGFAIRGFEGGRTAWARDFSNGVMLVVNQEGVSHVLSPKVPARVLFVAFDGSVLQDSGQPRRVSRHVPDLVTVRLTINATVDLNGESSEVARALLMRLVDQAILAETPPEGTSVRITDHSFESSSVASAAPQGTSDTDFSQLLDL